MSIYSNYWATAPSAFKGDDYTPPTAGFQTVHVQQQQIRQILQYRAMRAQYIKPNEITG